MTPRRDPLATSEDALLEVLDRACATVPPALAALEDWGPSGTRPGQYRLDVAADDAVLAVLHGAGLAVLSEESGRTGPDGPLLAVVDPVDGSTNAHRGMRAWSSSICVLDAEGPLAAVVVDHAGGFRYRAVRGAGAERDGVRLQGSGCTRMDRAIIALSGWPVGGERSWPGSPAGSASRSSPASALDPPGPGWAQFRALGAASLELCAVADGSLDGYTVAGATHLYGWDYLGALLVCREAGVALADRRGAEMVVRDDSPRHPAAAATPVLLDAVLALGL